MSALLGKTMAKKDEVTTPAVSGNVMFYENPVPLNKAQHAKFGVKQVEKPFAFMAEHHFLPLTAPEFGAASASMPIIFAGEERSPQLLRAAIHSCLQVITPMTALLFASTKKLNASRIRPRSSFSSIRKIHLSSRKKRSNSFKALSVTVRQRKK